MLDTAVPARFEDVDEADEIALHVRVRILDRVAHAGLRGEIDDAFRAEIAECMLQRSAILQRCAHQTEYALRRQPGKARLLERRIVVRVDVVIAEHFIAARQQPFAESCADEAGGTGDEDAHGRVLVGSRSNSLTPHLVIPAKAGIHLRLNTLSAAFKSGSEWMPAFAGLTPWQVFTSGRPLFPAA